MCIVCLRTLVNIADTYWDRRVDAASKAAKSKAAKSKEDGAQESKRDREDDEAEMDRDEDDMDVAGKGTTEDVNLDAKLKEPAETESEGSDSSEGIEISREAEASTADPQIAKDQMAKRKQRCVAAIPHRQLLFRCVLQVLTIYTFRMKLKRIEWYKWTPNLVIEEFDNAQAVCEFRVKIGSSRVPCTVLEAEDHFGWYVLVQRGDDKRVAKISLQKFRESIPKRLEHLRDKFDEWLADPATDKADFVEETLFEYLSDTRALRKTGEKPLSTADILKLKREKEKEVEDEVRGRKKARTEQPAWSYPPTGLKSFAGMCA